MESNIVSAQVQVVGGGNFPTIQQAVNAAMSGNIILVSAGVYNEDVLVNKSLTITGAGIDATIVRGVKSNPQLETFKIEADNVIIEKMTISRNGNNVAEWNDNLNNVGVGINAFHNAIIRFNKFTGNRIGLDINNSNGNQIHNNIIDCNRTGFIFRNNCHNNNIYENFITNNWTIGVLWLADSPGTATGTMFYNNNISGNWYAQVENRNNTGGVRNFSGNWLGACPPTTSTVLATEPGYNAHIPVKYGGGATNPGTAVSVRSVVIADVKYDPWLIDNNDVEKNKIGFQGDFKKIPVVDLGPDITRNINYPFSVRLTAEVTGGSGKFGYLWMPTGMTTKLIDVSPNVQTQYCVTVTDQKTCAAPTSDCIIVFISNDDIRCGNKNDKVLVCHNGNTLCISPNAAQAHINHGDVFGSCPGAARVIGREVELTEIKSMEIKVTTFPNPFINTTRLQYEIPFDGIVSIKLYDHLGRDISTIVNAERKAGSYFADVNGTNLNSGLYYFRIKLVGRNNELTSTVKIVRNSR